MFLAAPAVGDVASAAAEAVAQPLGAKRSPPGRREVAGRTGSPTPVF